MQETVTCYSQNDDVMYVYSELLYSMSPSDFRILYSVVTNRQNEAGTEICIMKY